MPRARSQSACVVCADEAEAGGRREELLDDDVGGDVLLPGASSGVGPASCSR